MRPVFITRLSVFLPNDPVSNEEMEGILGRVSDRTSKAQMAVLINNGIKTRYYAFRNGKSTHSSAQLAVTAINSLFDEQLPVDQLDLLSLSTSSPEQLLPSHASMVHGLMGKKNVEIVTSTGACCTGIQALKYGFMAVGTDNAGVAACCKSEKVSTWMRASRFQTEAENLERLQAEPIIAFEKDFLRFMLCDGAGAALLQSKPNETGISLKIEWIDIRSYANELETSMYAGAVKNADATLTGWNELSVQDWTEKSVFSFKQDTKLLGGNIIAKGGEYLRELMDKHGISEDKIDYFLPHLSSEYFKNEMITWLKKIGLDLPPEKWFYNLTKVGNIGSASAYAMLHELFNSGRLRQGDRILVMVPESARFTYGYMYLTVV